MADSSRSLLAGDSTPLRDLLIDAILESDGGPSQADEVWEAANIADDIMATHSWEKLLAYVKEQQP